LDTAITPRPRRSVLYVPASNARALEKSRGLAADTLILDLEDAVLPEAKVAAREAARRYCESAGPSEVIVRVNGSDSPWWADDLAALARSGAHGILLPKVDSPGDVIHAVAQLERQGAPANLQLWVMAETPRGLLDLPAILGASTRLTAVVMGTADLGKALRLPADPGRTALLPHLSQACLAARAQGLDILDGIFPDLADEPGFLSACRQGRALGFDGKTLIHPGQIPTANEVFGVTAEEAAAAADTLAAWEAAATAGRGIAVLNGRMIERLHAEDARRLLALRAALTGGPNAG
jgi:citrate lyase subunit beta / citryl-CoA lyase